MKTRWKVLITILLAVLAVWLQGVQERRTAHHANNYGEPSVSDLIGFYEADNQMFFGNKLPQNTIVDWDEHGDVMARTYVLPKDQFHIALNLKYSAAERVARLMVLHEMCHVKFPEEFDPEGIDHGPKWRACMLNLEMMGANRAILIDRYTGQ